MGGSETKGRESSRENVPPVSSSLRGGHDMISTSVVAHSGLLTYLLWVIGVCSVLLLVLVLIVTYTDYKRKQRLIENIRSRGRTISTKR